MIAPIVLGLMCVAACTAAACLGAALLEVRDNLADLERLMVVEREINARLHEVIEAQDASEERAIDDLMRFEAFFAAIENARGDLLNDMLDCAACEAPEDAE